MLSWYLPLLSSKEHCTASNAMYTSMSTRTGSFNSFCTYFSWYQTTPVFTYSLQYQKVKCKYITSSVVDYQSNHIFTLFLAFPSKLNENIKDTPFSNATTRGALIYRSHVQ